MNRIIHGNEPHLKSNSDSPSSDGFYSPKDIKNDAFSFSSPTLKDTSKNRFSNSNSSSQSHKQLKQDKQRSPGNLLSSIHNTLNEEIYHCLFLIVFNVQILLFSKVGAMCSVIALRFEYESIAQLFNYIGLLTAFFLFSWQHSFLSFEYKWIMEGIPLDNRLKYFEQRVPYFSGFGAPLTLMVLVAPSLISTGIYALTFPLFIIQAIESKPVYTNDNASILENEKRKWKKPARINIFGTTKLFQSILIWFCGNHFCCIRSVLICIQKCGKCLGI
eukprot:270584_1